MCLTVLVRYAITSNMDMSGLSYAQRQAAEKIYRACVHSRLYFVKEVLGVTPEKWQETVLKELDNGRTKKSIRSGHGVGKTALCSWLALHFLLFREDVKVIVTAPSADQMKDGLIPEINKWINATPEWLVSNLETTSERIVRNPRPENNFISFRTARKEKPEALAGVHATHVMIIVDEASGVEETIYETGQGSLSTEGAIALLIGNPTKPSGFFYKTQTILSDVWHPTRVSCLDSTRVASSYVMGQARTYSVDSREYRVRVLGEFPESGQNAVIPRSWVEAAFSPEREGVKSTTVWGVDPGRGGDPSGFIEREGTIITEMQELRYVDLMQLVGWVVQRYKQVPSHCRPETIYVDSIGLGAGVADRLSELGLPVVHINVSEAASMSDRFYNLRSELWYETRSYFESRDCAIKYDGPLKDKFIEQLAAQEEKLTSLGKIQMLSKEEMKKKGMPSPNLADALNMTFSAGGAALIGNTRNSWGKYDLSKYRVAGLA